MVQGRQSFSPGRQGMLASDANNAAVDPLSITVPRDGPESIAPRTFTGCSLDEAPTGGVITSKCIAESVITSVAVLGV